MGCCRYFKLKWTMRKEGLDGVKIMKRTKRLAITLVLLFTLGASVIAATAVSASSSPVHFEFRWYSANDQTGTQVKNTTSAYVLNSTSTTRPWYTAWAAGYLMVGPNPGHEVGVTLDESYRVYANKTYYLTNYLVEWYGKGNQAFISANSIGDGNAYGTWQADR